MLRRRKCERDGAGRRVPSRLAGVFSGAAVMHGWNRKLRGLQVALASAESQPWSLALEVPQLIQRIEAVAQRISEAMPAAVCNCSVRDINCPRCKGVGWLTDCQRRAELNLKQQCK